MTTFDLRKWLKNFEKKYSLAGFSYKLYFIISRS